MRIQNKSTAVRNISILILLIVTVLLAMHGTGWAAYRYLLVENDPLENWEDITFMAISSFSIFVCLIGFIAYGTMGITCYHAFDWLAIIAAIANLAGFGISIYTVIYVFERVAVGETHTLIYKIGAICICVSFGLVAMFLITLALLAYFVNKKGSFQVNSSGTITEMRHHYPSAVTRQYTIDNNY